MLDHAFERFPGKVQPVELGVAMFQLGDQAKRVRIMIEPADGSCRCAQRLLAGMTERRVAEIVR